MRSRAVKVVWKCLLLIIVWASLAIAARAGAVVVPYAEDFEGYPIGTNPTGWVTTGGGYGGVYQFWGIASDGVNQVYRGLSSGDFAYGSAEVPVRHLGTANFRVSTDLMVGPVQGPLVFDCSVGLGVLGSGLDFSGSGYYLGYETGASGPNLRRAGEIFLRKGSTSIGGIPWGDPLVPVTAGKSYTLTLEGIYSSAGLTFVGRITDGTKTISFSSLDKTPASGGYAGYHVAASGMINHAVGSGAAFDNFSVKFPKLGFLKSISTRTSIVPGHHKAALDGFIITGSEPKKVLIRARGPSLSDGDALPDPILEIYDHSSGAVVATNDNWRTNENTAEIQATGLAPTKGAEAALLLTLNPGTYAAVERGANGSSGLGVLEIFDLSGSDASKLANISSGGFIDGGPDSLATGFRVGGGLSQRVLLRAIAPSLRMPGTIPDPTLELRDENGSISEANDNWRSRSNGAEIIATGIPPQDDRESALVTWLPPGSYTATMRDATGESGLGLVEVYALEPY
jgi:hypothetical protein